MTPDELRAACDACGWTPQQVAARCGYHRNTGTAWTKGLHAVPPEVAKWLARVARLMEKNPPPERQERGSG